MAHPTLQIVEVRADDPAAVGAAYETAEAAVHAQVPELPPECRYQYETSFALPPPALERHVYLALEGDTPAGSAQLDLPVLDNLDKAHLDVHVPPRFRRRGVGRALLRHAAAIARDKGRHTLLGFGPAMAELDGFAQAAGLRNGLTDDRRRLLVADIDEAELARLEADARARAAGYSLVQWRNELPAEHIDDIAALDSSFVTETPNGDLDYEPEKVDAARLRRQYETLTRWGVKRYETGVVHEETGRLVAWTAFRVTRTVGWHSWQLITLVHPGHRGRRLGLLAKTVNLRHLRDHEPAVTTIDTFNAASNSYMIAINEAMGFRFREQWANWQGPNPA